MTSSMTIPLLDIASVSPRRSHAQPCGIASVFDPTLCALTPVSRNTARRVIQEAHYIGTLGSTSISLGLKMSGQIAGVICFGTIPGNNAASICGPDYAPHVLELTRLALYDWAPSNSESWVIGQAFRWITANRPDISILISYADPSAGHVGTIYQATNWVYTGMSTGDVVWQCDDGSVLHPRTTGWKTSNMPKGKFRPSPGKHRYVAFVGHPAKRRSIRKTLRWMALPYPKARDA